MNTPLVRADIDRPLIIGPISSRANPQLPRESPTGVLPKMLISNKTEIFYRELTPQNRLSIEPKNPLIVTALPRINKDR